MFLYFQYSLNVPNIKQITNTFLPNDVQKLHTERDLICCYGNMLNFNFKHDLKDQNHSLVLHDVLCIQFTDLEKCCLYLMINPRI